MQLAASLGVNIIVSMDQSIAEFLCDPGTINTSVCTAEEIEASGSQLSKTWPLIIGQLLIGLGTAGMAPLAVTYVDDAVEKRLLPMYLCKTGSLKNIL